MIDVDDEVHGELPMPGVVPRLDGTPGSVRQAARWTVGADTAEVLRELGVDAERLAAMAARDAVLAPAERRRIAALMRGVSAPRAGIGPLDAAGRAPGARAARRATR